VEIHIESIEETVFQVFSRSYSGSMSVPQSGWHWQYRTNCLGVRIRVLLSGAISYIETQASVRHNFLLNTTRHFTSQSSISPFRQYFSSFAIEPVLIVTAYLHPSNSAVSFGGSTLSSCIALSRAACSIHDVSLDGTYFGTLSAILLSFPQDL
jgi:hypothetical protein